MGLYLWFGCLAIAGGQWLGVRVVGLLGCWGGCGLRCCRASLLVVGVVITVGDWLVWVWVYK